VKRKKRQVAEKNPIPGPKRDGETTTREAKATLPRKSAARASAQAVGTSPSPGDRRAGVTNGTTETAPPPKVLYEPSERERIALERQRARRAADLTPRIKMLEVTEQGASFVPDHPDIHVANKLLAEAFGTADLNFTYGLIGDIINGIIRDGKVDEVRLNFAVAVIKGIRPTDELEAMLAAQMAVVHTAMMLHGGLLYRTETMQHQEIVAGALSKLSRTYAMLMDTLKRYRSGGQQTVTVQHVSIGGQNVQAVVGDVNPAGSKARPKKSQQPPLALSDMQQPAMPIIEHPIRKKAPVRAGPHNDQE
jgi:hypothetical protein